MDREKAKSLIMDGFLVQSEIDNAKGEMDSVRTKIRSNLPVIQAGKDAEVENEALSKEESSINADINKKQSELNNIMAELKKNKYTIPAFDQPTPPTHIRM